MINWLDENIKKNATMFASSFISLALIKGGYVVSKDVLLGDDMEADLVAMREANGSLIEKFVVELKVLKNRNNLSRSNEFAHKKLEKFEKGLKLKAYLAFFIDEEDLFILDNDLHNKMRYVDDEISIEIINGPSDDSQDSEPEMPDGPRM